MKKRVTKLGAVLFLVCLFFGITSNATHAYYNQTEAFLHCEGGERVEFSPDNTSDNGVKVSSRIYELFFGDKDSKNQELKLIPGGDIFGIRIKEEYLTVTSTKEASIFKKGDKIVSINGEKIQTADAVTDILSKCTGKAVSVELLRNGEKMTVNTTPILEDGIYKLGINLRSFTSGIGTITFIDPNSGAFGGLGHAVIEPESNKIVKVDNGEVCSALLCGIKKGDVGKPGELAGVLGKRHIGSIEKNNECGIFGILDEPEARIEKAIPVAHKDDLTLGEAEIISTVKNGKTMHYKIQITSIDKSSTGSKSFKIKVTDPALLALTGGIVRGMSGSPIIQNGKLVGAVTHVMVANPTEGYGIFIENMLNSVHQQNKPNAA